MAIGKSTPYGSILAAIQCSLLVSSILALTDQYGFRDKKVPEILGKLLWEPNAACQWGRQWKTLGSCLAFGQLLLDSTYLPGQGNVPRKSPTKARHGFTGRGVIQADSQLAQLSLGAPLAAPAREQRFGVRVHAYVLRCVDW